MTDRPTDAPIAAFCGALGLPAPTFNDDGEVELLVNDQMTVFITPVEDDAVEFSAVILNVDLKNPTVLRAMLQANTYGIATGFGRLGMLPAAQEALYCERWSTDQLTAEYAGDRFEDFAKTLAFWMTDGTEMLAGFAKEDREAETDPTDTLITFRL